VLIDAAEQGSAFGIQGFQPGVLLPQLLCFFLDLLAVVPHPQDLALELFHPLLVLNPALLELLHPALIELLHPALLVTGILTPIEQRQELSPPRPR
jgi:hypothetical protein